MGRHQLVACQICFKQIRSDTLKRHMKVHEKYESNSKYQTNEEICKDLVMGLVDNILEKMGHKQLQKKIRIQETKDLN